MKKIIFLIGFALTFLIANILRTIQLIVMTDPATGFYSESYEGLGNILNWVILLITVVIIVLGIISKQKQNIATPKPNNFLGIASIMLGVSLAIEPLFVVDLPSTVPDILGNIKTILVVLSGITFVVLGFINFLGKKPNYIIIVIPTLSYVARLLVTFICYTGMSGISQNIYEILNLCCIIAFLHFSSKILCNVESKNSNILVSVTAYLSIISASLCSIPQMVATLFGLSGIHTSVDSIITNLFIVIYVIAFLVSKKQEKEEVLESIHTKL